jgi:hypothetical protein
MGEGVLGVVETPRFDTVARPARSTTENTSHNMGGPTGGGNAGVMSATANPDAIKTAPPAANAGQSKAMAENASKQMDGPIVDAKAGVLSAAANPDAIKATPLVANAGQSRAMAENVSNQMERPIVDAKDGVMGAAVNRDATKTSPLAANLGPSRAVEQDASNQTDGPIVEAKDGEVDAAANPAAIKIPPLDAAAGRAKGTAGYTSNNVERPAIDADDRSTGPSVNPVSGEIKTALPDAIDGGHGSMGDHAQAKENAPALAPVSTGTNEHRDAADGIEAPAEERVGDVSLPVTRTVSAETARNEAGSGETKTSVPELSDRQTGESALKGGPDPRVFISPSTNRVIRSATDSAISASLPRTKESGISKIDSPDEESDAPTQTLSTSKSSGSLFAPILGNTPPQGEAIIPLRPSGGARSHSTAAVTATAAKANRSTAQPLIAANPTPGSGEHNASESAAHSTANPVKTLPHANRPSEAVQGTVAQHGFNVAQTTSSTTSAVSLHGQISLAEKPAGVSPTLAATASREPFAAIDAGFVQARPTWIHAGAKQAEAGYQDAALGWVGVRAEVSGGSIHAALVPGSADAAQALSGHMAGLNAYLTDHHAGVEKLTLAAAPQEQSTDSGMGQGSSQNMQQGTGQNSGQGPAPDQHWMNRIEAPPVSLAASVEARTAETMLDVNAYAVRTDGVHISVLA